MSVPAESYPHSPATPGPDGDSAGWLMAAAPQPGLVLADWAGHPESLADIPAGRAWDVVRAPADRGLDAVDRLRWRHAPLGPVLYTAPRASVEILVPTGTAAGWAVPGTLCVSRGGWLRCPMPGLAESATGGRVWLVPPDGSGWLTDPGSLAEELAAAGRPAAGIVRLHPAGGR